MEGRLCRIYSPPSVPTAAPEASRRCNDWKPEQMARHTVRASLRERGGGGIFRGSLKLNDNSSRFGSVSDSASRTGTSSALFISSKLDNDLATEQGPTDKRPPSDWMF